MNASRLNHVCQVETMERCETMKRLSSTVSHVEQRGFISNCEACIHKSFCVLCGSVQRQEHIEDEMMMLSRDCG